MNKLLQNIKIRTKVITIVLLFSFLSLFVFLFSFATLSSVKIGSKSYEEISTYQLSLQKIALLQANVFNVQAAFSFLLSETDGDKQKQIQSDVDELCTIVDSRFEELAKDVESEDEKMALGNALSTWEKYRTVNGEEILPKIAEGEMRDAIAKSMGPQATRITRVAEQLSSMTDMVGLKIDDIENTTKASVQNYMALTIGIFAIMFLISILFAVFIILSITRNIYSITDILKDISEGEGDLSKRINVISRNEIGTLSKYFNIFLEKLAYLISDLKSIGDNNTLIGDRLEKDSSEVSAVTTEIASIINSMKERIVFHSNEVTKVNQLVERINLTIHKVEELIQNQSAAVSESSSSIQEMIASIQNIARVAAEKQRASESLAECAKNGQNDMKKTVDLMQEISKSSETMAEMAAVINDVVSQINILAMNAAIEAAHAGDFGRGFSIVATEVRGLAEKTGASSKEISKSIKNIIERINTSSSSTMETSRSFNEIIGGITSLSQSMNEMQSGLQELSIGSNQITEALTNLVSITQNVSESSSTMFKGTGEIQESIKSIASMADENKNGMIEINSGITNIIKSIASLSELSTSNKQSIKALETEISKFKI